MLFMVVEKFRNQNAKAVYRRLRDKGRGFPDGLKFVVILSGSFAVSMCLYEFLVRRFNVMRVLFGMKPLKRAASVATRPVQPALEKA